MVETCERLHLRIVGVVQGVFFRVHTRDEASRLGLSGWVRNCPDGSVEAMAEGPRAALEQLERWCHRGSPSAVVERVEVSWGEASGQWHGFSVRH